MSLLRRAVSPARQPALGGPSWRRPLLSDDRWSSALRRGRDELAEALMSARLGKAFRRGLTDKQQRRLLTNLTISARSDADDVSQRLADGEISLARWQRSMTENLLASHVAAALAATGRSRLGPEDAAVLRPLVERQLAYLTNFRAEVASGAHLLGDATTARARMYGRAIRATALEVQRQGKRRDGYTHEIRVLGGTERHCTGPRSCPALAGKVAPIGTLPAIGDTPCRTNCNCHFEYFREAPPEPGPSPPPLPSYGPSAAEVRAADDSPAGLEAILAEAGRILGRPGVTAADLASLAGAPDDALVEVAHRATGQVEMRVVGPGYEALRLLRVAEGGRSQLYNDSLEVERARQGKGLGSRVFGRQVEQAARLGVSSIETFAAGSPGDEHYNGYYTWPRLGYDGPIPMRVREELPAGYTDVRRVSELMYSDFGRAWWKANGAPLTLEFDLAEGSLSRRVWEEYRAEKARRSGGG